MITLLFEKIFGCAHSRTTFPLTAKRRSEASGSGKRTYVVCLECAKEFDYNWTEMRIEYSASKPPSSIISQPGQIVAD